MTRLIKTAFFATVALTILAAAVGAQILSNGARVQESITGSGNFTDGFGDFRTFAFQAHKFSDGTVRGQWTRINHTDDFDPNHGIITCFSIIGNQVLVGGFANTGVFSTPPNNEMAFHFVDNGQGKNSPPDQISLQFVGAVPGFAQDYCDGGIFSFTPPLNDVEAGNLKIHVKN